MKHCNPILREIDHRDDIPHFLRHHGLTELGVEVGTFAGAFAEHILSNWPGRLVCVDPYRLFAKSEYFDSTQSLDQERVFKEAVTRLARFGSSCTQLRMTSAEASKQFAQDSLDFIFIDGNHSYDATSEDISLWYPKVRSGGLFAGHDFNTRQRDTNTDVVNAVLDFAEKIDTRPHVTWCTSWYFIKP